MAIAAVQVVAEIAASASSTTLTVPVGQNNGVAIPGFVSLTVGNRIILAIGLTTGATITGITDTQGNTYTVDSSSSNASFSNAALCSAYITTALGASDSITVTSSIANKPEVVAAEYSGIATTSWVESVHSISSGSNAATTTGTESLTPAAPTSQLFGSVSTTSGSATHVTDGNGFYTQRGWSGSNALMDDLANSGTTAIAGVFNWAGSARWAYSGVVYVAAPTTLTSSVTFTGAGSLAVSGNTVHRRSVALGGTGSLAATGATVHRRSVAFAGTGSLTVNGHRQGLIPVWLPMNIVFDTNATSVVLSAERGLTGDGEFALTRRAP